MIYLVWFILICVALFFIKKFLNKFKLFKVGCLVPVVGGVKSGKSTVSCFVVDSTFKHNLRVTKFKNFFRKLFKKPLQLLPVIYSNVPLNVDYVPVTRALLLRQEKPIEGSVVYLQEASLVADSQLIKNMDLNNALLLFFKLCGHQGISVVLDTQSTSDLHYSIKRSMSQTIYVRHLIKWIPFLIVAEVVEYNFTEDGSFTFAQNEDMDNIVKKVLIPKRIWKKFDCRAYSILTDKKPYVQSAVVKKGTLKDLKARNIISFRPEFNISMEDENEKKKL